MRSLAVLCAFAGAATALRPSLRVPIPHLRAGAIQCAEPTAGKGFGAPQKPAPSAPARKAGAPAAAPVPVVQQSVAEEEGLAGAEQRGRLALEKLRAESGQKPIALKRSKRGPALTPEELEPMDPSAGVMPQVVSDRMLNRVVPFAGLPILLGACIFAGFFYANTQLELDLPPSIVAYTTQLCVLLSFAGITWGVMSTSWDEEIEGSFLGAEQVGRNFDLMRGGEDQRREQAKLEFAEADAAKDGVIMNRQQLAKKRGKD
mmetsp:Transcript_68262/g.181690  ORF Transcript_68262/g.181690 Transcript_68262/m.181690 type:complete len:260 (+) Transcript_68262:18-797(+)